MIIINIFKKWTNFWKQPAWKLSKKQKKKSVRIIASTSHRSIEEAIMADVVDAIPIAGDVSNAIKVIDAAKRKESTAVILQSGDMIIGLVPVIGDIADLITPTNFIVYILRKKKLRSELKNKYG